LSGFIFLINNLDSQPLVIHSLESYVTRNIYVLLHVSLPIYCVTLQLNDAFLATYG